MLPLHALVPKYSEDPDRDVVPRFRGAHHFAASSVANFGIKGAVAVSILQVIERDPVKLFKCGLRDGEASHETGMNGRRTRRTPRQL
jgi:hypothetical protein